VIFGTECRGGVRLPLAGGRVHLPLAGERVNVGVDASAIDTEEVDGKAEPRVGGAVTEEVVMNVLSAIDTDRHGFGESQY
jgi:hypothetical protein